MHMSELGIPDADVTRVYQLITNYLIITPVRPDWSPAQFHLTRESCIPSNEPTLKAIIPRGAAQLFHARPSVGALAAC